MMVKSKIINRALSIVSLFVFLMLIAQPVTFANASSTSDIGVALPNPISPTFNLPYTNENAVTISDINNIFKSTRRNVQAQIAALTAGNHKSDELIVKFKSTTTESTKQRLLGSSLITSASTAIGTHRVKTPPGTDIAQEITRLQNSGEIEFVEPNYKRQISFTPNDTNYIDQWSLPKINAPLAWEISKGSPALSVAVLDTGIDYTHPELTAQTLAGINYAYSNMDPYDDNGHGTMVSGIIAAAMNNSSGITGLAPDVKILPVKVADSTGSAYTADIADGIIYAVDNGAKVINLSLGSSTWSDLEFSAVYYAYQHGVTVVAAAGNGSANIYNFPASYPLVISVGSTDSSDVRSTFSNYNKAVDLVAPGQHVLSTVPLYTGYSYAWGSGTSFATPHVSAVAALVLSTHPGYTPGEVEQSMKDSAVDLGSPGRDDYYGWGRIDAYASCTAVMYTVDSYEPNYSSGLAKSVIGDGREYLATVYPAQDVDHYKVTCFSGQTLTVDITPPADLDATIHIYDSLGNQLAYVDNSSLGGSEHASTPIQSAGTYYVVVTDELGASSKGQYSMRVNTTPFLNLPTLELNSPVDGFFTNVSPITVSGKTRNVSAVTLSVNGSNSSIPVDADGYFTTQANLIPGSNSIYVDATNNFGSDSATRGGYYNYISPSLTINYPPNNLVTTANVITVSATSDVDCVVSINGISAPFDPATTRFTLPFTLKSGPNTITVTSTDPAGNVTTVNRKVTNADKATGIWNFSSNGSTFTQSLAWLSAPNGFPWLNSKSVAGDFNGDGKNDVAVLYNYGANTIGIWNFISTSSGTAYSPRIVWKSAIGQFSWANCKLTSGDVNGDGKSDLIVLYNNGSNTTTLYFFISNGVSFTPSIAWKSNPGAFSWTNSKLSSGDFNGDNKDDVLIFYNYGNNTTGIWAFISNGTSLSPRLTWKSAAGGFSWDKGTIARADVNADLKDDLAILYDYGGNTSGIWTFFSTGSIHQPRLTWKSAAGTFSSAQGLLTAGDINGDGKDDPVILSKAPDNNSVLTTFISNGNATNPVQSWKATSVNWNHALLQCGDYNGDKKADIQVFCDFN